MKYEKYKDLINNGFSPVFVYGTLKQGFKNSGTVKVFDYVPAVTADKYMMYDHFTHPVIASHRYGKNITGQILLVDHNERMALDDGSGLHVIKAVLTFDEDIQDRVSCFIVRSNEIEMLRPPAIDSSEWTLEMDNRFNLKGMCQ